MNIVFMGTPDFAVPTLQMLIDEGHTIQAVVTQPDKPKGRGKKEAMSPVKELALQYDLEVLQPERIKGNEAFYDHIKALNPDVMIVVAYGKILPVAILEIPRLGCINIHGSLLPAYRGAAPIQWSVINDEAVTGVTIMYMDEGMDTGDMLLTREMPLAHDETYASLHDKMKHVGAEALREALPLIEAGGEGRQKQDHEKATYAPPIQKTLGEIDWTKEASVIDALVRGVNPWPAAYTFYEGQIFKIWVAEKMDAQGEGSPGTIISVDKTGIKVQTGKGMILIKELQAPNKKRMPVSEYIKGNIIEPGQLLGR